MQTLGKIKGLDFIQTDISVKKGSAIVPLLRNNRGLHGFVNNKVYDYRVQGLGFAIRNNMINSFLRGEERKVEHEEVDSDKVDEENEEEITEEED